MIRTILFFTWFWVSLALTMPFLLLFLLLKLLRLERPLTGLIWRVVQIWARGLVAAAGVRVHLSGMDRIPRTGPVCIVADHQGNFDIVLALAYLPRFTGFVAKREALIFPFLNLWILALDSVFLDRGSLKRGKDAIDKGIAKIARGHSILVFPEGTRSRGKPVGEFKHGSFKLATRSGAALVPLSIQGSAGAWEMEKRIRPVDISFVAHEPIATAGMSAEARQALPERVKAIIVEGIGASSR